MRGGLHRCSMALLVPQMSVATRNRLNETGYLRAEHGAPTCSGNRSAMLIAPQLRKNRSTQPFRSLRSLHPVWSKNRNGQRTQVSYPPQCSGSGGQSGIFCGDRRRGRWPKIFGTVEEPVLDRAIEACRSAELGATGSKAASAILDLSIAARRIAESEFRIEPWACDHAAS